MYSKVVDPKYCDITYGVEGDEQRTAFENSTLQSTDDEQVDYSIATYVKIPDSIAAGGEKVIGQWLQNFLGGMSYISGSIVTFEVQIGPGENYGN